MYRRPYDPKRPVACTGEAFKQLIGEVRGPLPCRPGGVDRFGHVYARDGVASLFPASEPPAGWRAAPVTGRRRRVERAGLVKSPVGGRHKDADEAVLVMDQPHTHGPQGLYEAFEPEAAKRIADRLEAHHTPKRGSWLNVAETEPGAPGRQCLSRRVARQQTLAEQAAYGERDRNRSKSRVGWQFTTADARVELRRLHPSVHG